MQDEASLIGRAQKHDQRALTQLYEENFERIYRYIVLKIGDRIEAEDMTQQVFIRALKSISTYRWQGKPFAAWLYRIAHNQIVDYLRKKSKYVTVGLDERLRDKDPDPVAQLEKKMEVEKLSAATRKLTKAQQEVISLRFTSELPIAQVAKIMGKSEGAVKALQHSAILALRKNLVTG